ncbi:hypothetical protein QBC42DRAFT_37459 [Cladorrhinum samala]|uniref:G1/S-specific cyclin pas1 n=1 Tax=Cladorrhinum samala TaxID=585594 RepID=A0AAV9HDL0_9PEZI|nr:hypothetical protein QBC42DRAFT_37459 [Cladorrhinum samala]
MKFDTFVSSSIVNPLHNALYNPPLAVLASTSTASLWSDASSQHPEDATSNGSASDSEASDCFSIAPISSSQTSVSSLGSYCEPRSQLCDPWAAQQIEQQPQYNLPPVELRQNPRRTSNSATSRTGRPPTLVRQDDRKGTFVDNLIETSTHIVEAIWPTSSVVSCKDSGNSTVLPLRTFIQETLRRSRTSYSTLQVALYYLILIKPRVPTHDFTMEQPDDNHARQALQCGRRMFLSALILASKYLQDRNFSARAWSKISGLNTLEINQNEMAFVLAVNWNLHVTEEVYKRWAESVMKLTPTQPPSSGGSTALRIYHEQCEQFRRIILQISPDLSNLEQLAPWLATGCSPRRKISVESICSPPDEAVDYFSIRSTPSVLEPTPSASVPSSRFAPALGPLPTPRLTPQSRAFSIPAVNAVAPRGLARCSSMGFAMAHASSAAASQSLDRWPSSSTSPVHNFTRRSSLANSISTASSPESMVSDSSRYSRSSSISSATSVSAPSLNDAQARFRCAKPYGERLSLKPTIASVPEIYEETACFTSSPESYAGTVSKDFGGCEVDDAARALQELHRHGSSLPAPPVKAGSKRSRTLSMDNNTLQDQVRGMLGNEYPNKRTWPESMVRGVGQTHRVTMGAKRLCCSTEAAQPYMMSSLHPAVGGIGGPGMWEGILN